MVLDEVAKPMVSVLVHERGGKACGLIVVYDAQEKTNQAQEVGGKARIIFGHPRGTTHPPNPN